MDEERQRFASAAPVMVVPAGFAASLSRLLRACLRACPATNWLTIRFVQAGPLHLQLSLDLGQQVLRIHERWLSADGSARELGLGPALPHAHLLFHAAKRLFRGALQQLPPTLEQLLPPVASPGSLAHRSDESRRRELCHAEQHLLSDLCLQPVTVSEAGAGALSLRWARGHANAIFEIQCHKARCAGVLEDKLISRDGGFLLLFSVSGCV